jgi:phenylacetate-CoA ligase
MGLYFDPDVETSSTERLREIQFSKLRKIFETVNRSNPFYKQKFREHGVEIEEITSLDHLSKLPFSLKDEYQRDQDENPPFGTNLSEPTTQMA